MPEYLEPYLNDIKNICQKYKVKVLYAFGSVCTTNFRMDSDIDLIYSFKKIPILDYSDYYFNFKDDLEELLHRDIDLLSEKSMKNPFLIKVVEKTKTKIYEG
jgi:uncharacterized protein